LAQQASWYEIRRGLFVIEEKPMIVPVNAHCNESTAVTQEAGTTNKVELIVQQDLGGMSTVDIGEEGQNGLMSHSREDDHEGVHESAIAEEGNGADWRQPLIEYLRAPDGTTDQKVHKQALKYTLLNGDLYQ
jgi:hypothetical protein